MELRLKNSCIKIDHHGIVLCIVMGIVIGIVTGIVHMLLHFFIPVLS